MDYLHALFLAALQGLTEFLPISSSAHLILVPQLLGWADQGLTFDVAVHLGTLFAVVVYLRHTLRAILTHGLTALKGGPWNGDALMGVWVVLATLPVVCVGLFAGSWIELMLRGALVIAGATAFFALVLAWADARSGQNQRSLQRMSAAHALTVGLAQALALIPGTSRSGITMTAMLALGYSRIEAAQFSFLLAIPAILASGAYKSVALLRADESIDYGLLLLSMLVSAGVAFLCIKGFIQLVERIGMRPFVLYRLLLAAVILWVVV